MSETPPPGLSTPLVGLVYVSSARTWFSDTALRDLLAAARQNNQIHQITGILVYWDGNFIQYIEGPAAEIDQLMVNLRRDPRHGDVIILQREDVAARAFPDWSMAFDRKSDASIDGRTGMSDYLSDGFLNADSETFSPTARLLLDAFRRHIR